MKTKIIKIVLISFSVALVTVVVFAWVYLSKNGLDSVCDSTNGGCSTSEVLEGNDLTRIFLGENLAVRRVIPMQFTGYYGFDYIRYAVPVDEVENEIREWQKEPDKFKSTMPAYPGYPDFRIPKWWPAPQAVIPVGYVYKQRNKTDIRIWVDKQIGTFYISTEWGH